MKKFLILLLLLMPAALPAAPAPVSTSLGAAKDLVADAARWEIAAKRIPSIAIAVIDKDGVAWSDAWGFANIEKSVPASPASIYRAGSISKLLTDIAVMKLVEAGKLDLDAPVTTYLPEFRPHNPFRGSITLRHLMTHRSGLVREAPRGHYFDTSPKSQADAVRSLNETTLVAAPGQVMKYSNAAVAVVGEVIARVTGLPYERAISEMVLKPLGMTSSGMSASPFRSRVAYSEMASFDGPRFPAPALDLGTPAAGNLYTTVGDLGRLAQVLLNRGAFSGGGMLLRPASLDEMWRPQSEGARTFGLGFILSQLDGHRVVGHGGQVYGHSAEMKILPDENLAVVVFSTVDSSNSATKLADYAIRTVLASRGGGTAPAFAKSEPITGTEAKRLSGWFSNGQASVATRIFNERLVLEGPEIVGEVHRLGNRYVLEDAQTYSDKLAIAPDGSWIELAGSRYARTTMPKPAHPPADFLKLMGEFGWEHNALRIYERDGQPHVRIEWVEYSPLRRLDANTYAMPRDHGFYKMETLRFERDRKGEPTAALLNGIRFPRRDFGREVEARIHAGVRTGAAELRKAALKASPPPEVTTKPNDLVSLSDIDPTIRLDIRYATRDNFMGIPVYERAAAYMQRPAAEAVARANRTLHTFGYGLLIHDAYRPWFVTKMFWDATPPDNRVFVADPSQGSRHNRGAAVDLTMYELATGKPVVMPGRYDEFSSRCYTNYVGGSDHQRWLRELLRRAMEAEGFEVFPEEWWHFDFIGWREYPINNESFDDLARRGKLSRNRAISRTGRGLRDAAV